MKKMISKVALAAVLSVAPMSGALYANTPPPAPVTTPVDQNEAISWMQGFTGTAADMYDWLTYQVGEFLFTPGLLGDIGYFVYNEEEDAQNSLMYYFNTALQQFYGIMGWSAYVNNDGDVVAENGGKKYKHKVWKTFEATNRNDKKNYIDKSPLHAPNIPDKQRNVPVPIDGGASLLLAAGAAYGIKRFKKSKKA